jgi:hypothetical protein
MEESDYMDHVKRQALIAAMGSPEHSTDDLDLTTLPERLDDTTLARVKAIASSPLPPPIPCSDPHLSKCLRIMLSVLPRRNADDVSGELFVAAYQRKLGHLPDAAVSYITDKAMEQCRWFPTIAECLELLSGWRRKDVYTERQIQARLRVRAEREAREADERAFERRDRSADLTQEQVDNMPPHVLRLGVACGAIIRSEDGSHTPRPVEVDEDGIRW